mmetsp:Transcript_12158/g.35191  ORF Transcript_12158/g.35191 Transcript_12158/m.35191 type:complete len:310 (+) Transcript_12158:398-1327(+)
MRQLLALDGISIFHILAAFRPQALMVLPERRNPTSAAMPDIIALLSERLSDCSLTEDIEASGMKFEEAKKIVTEWFDAISQYVVGTAPRFDGSNLLEFVHKSLLGYRWKVKNHYSDDDRLRWELMRGLRVDCCDMEQIKHFCSAALDESGQLREFSRRDVVAALLALPHQNHLKATVQHIINHSGDYDLSYVCEGLVDRLKSLCTSVRGDMFPTEDAASKGYNELDAVLGVFDEADQARGSRRSQCSTPCSKSLSSRCLSLRDTVGLTTCSARSAKCWGRLLSAPASRKTATYVAVVCAANCPAFHGGW